MGTCLSRQNTELRMIKNYGGKIDVYIQKPHPSIAFSMTLGDYPALEHRIMKAGRHTNNCLVYYGAWDTSKTFCLTIERNTNQYYQSYRNIRQPMYQLKISLKSRYQDYSEPDIYYIYGL